MVTKDPTRLAQSAANIEETVGSNRREQLLDVGIKLFSQKGFQGTTTKEIALAAGVSEALVFRYFKTKQELYGAILAQKTAAIDVSAWIEGMRQYAEQGDDQQLFQLLSRRIIEHYYQDPDFLRLMLYSALERHELAQGFFESYARPLTTFLVEYIQQRQIAGIFIAGNPEALVRGLVGIPSHHAIVNALFGDVFNLDIEEAIGIFALIMLNGLRVDSAAR
jgi:AcrR family transcriptional regulator